MALPLQEEQKTLQAGQGTIFKKKNKTKQASPLPAPKCKQKPLHPATKPTKQKATNPQKQKASPPKNVLGNGKRAQAQTHMKITLAVSTSTYRIAFSEQCIALITFSSVRSFGWVFNHPLKKQIFYNVLLALTSM